MNQDMQGIIPLYSEMRNDPDMAELVDLFTSEMPDRLRQVRTAWETSDLTTVQRLAHQLRGAACGYGFPALGKVAGALEDSLRANKAAALSNEVLISYREFTNVCQRVAAANVRKAA